MADNNEAAANRSKSLTGEAPAAQRLGRPPGGRLPVPPALSQREAAETVGADEQTGERMVRRRRRVEDKFHFDTNKVPAGWCYEWKRHSTYGMADVDHAVNLRENMWRPVPSDRHPEMMPTSHKGPIERNGMILMERPQYLTDEARLEDYEYAMAPIRSREAQLGITPSGTFTRNHPSVQQITRIQRSYGPIDPER